MVASIWTELSAYSIPEMTAVVASFIYVLLAAKPHRYCWPAAFIGSIIYVAVFWQYQLLMDSALNVYYAGMAVFGWLMWTKQRPHGITDNDHSEKNQAELKITTWPWRKHVLALTAILLLSLASGYWLQHNSNAAFPYLDSLTTYSSLIATWMVAKKILENWLYWLVIDATSIYLYINKALYFTTALFAVYVIIAAYGYINWRRMMRQT